MDVFRQRLNEEHDLRAIMTQPNVSYLCKLRGDNLENDGIVRVDNPAECPKAEIVAYWKECIVKATLITPREYAKGIKDLCVSRRG